MTIITEKAMLARLKISRWGASKHDRAISEQVAVQHQADPSMGRYSKRLVARERLEEIRQIATRARHHHYENTLPWLDDGARILPAANYFDYMAQQNALKADDVDPMPTAEDFRVALSEDENARIREQIQGRLDQAVDGAMHDVWQRMFTAVEHMVERLRAFEVDQDGKVKNTFRDSLVDNVRSLVELLPKLNITGSNQLEDMRHRLADELCQIDTWDLRQDQSQREQVASKAEAILEELKDVMA
jgi:hypothetical protein